MLLDCTLTADSIPLHCEPDASWLFMADARVLRPLSSAHTWLLWDEVTTPILARTLQTPWKQCCFTSHRLSTYQTRITNLVYKYGHHPFFIFWNSYKNHLLLESVLPPVLSVFSQLHPCPSPSPLSCIPHSPLPSSLPSLLCRSWTDLFFPVQQSWRESTRLYLSAAEIGPASWWMTLDPLVRFTCSHLRLPPPQHLLCSQ